MSEATLNTLAAYRPKQTPAAILWLLMALFGLSLAALFFGVACLSKAAWAIRAYRDTLSLLFMTPALLASGTWWCLAQGLLARFERKDLRDLQYLLFAAWMSISGAIIVAHVWANQAWVVPTLPASWALAVGSGALLPLLIHVVFPRALSRETSAQ